MAEKNVECCQVHKKGKCDAVFTCCGKCPSFFADHQRDLDDPAYRQAYIVGLIEMLDLANRGKEKAVEIAAELQHENERLRRALNDIVNASRDERRGRAVTAASEVEQWKARYEQVKAERDALREDIRLMDSLAGLVQVGWMLSPDLAAEFDVTPLSDDYLITLEQAEQDGGIKDEFQSRVIPIYRKAATDE